MPVWSRASPDSVCLCPFFQSVDVLPDMQHPAHGPPGSTNANSHHPGRHQAPHFLGVHLLRLGVRFPSRDVFPRIPYLTWYFVASLGLAFCPYRIGTRMREISIPPLVRQKEISCLLFSLMPCIQLALHISSYLAHSPTSSGHGASGGRMRPDRGPPPNQEHQL